MCGGIFMKTATVRIPEDKRDILKVISSLEKRDIKEILSELIDEYVERHRETLEILSNPDWVEQIKVGREEIRKGIGGKTLDELED
jgi:predicted CopG family antitoxin